MRAYVRARSPHLRVDFLYSVPGMKPSRVASSLREIADKIDRSEQPSIVRVSSAVRGVLAAMDDGTNGQLQSEVLKALQKVDFGSLLSMGEEEVLEIPMLLDESLGYQDHGVLVKVHPDKNGGIAVTVDWEGTNEWAYEGPFGPQDLVQASNDVVSMIEDQFDMLEDE